MTLNGIEFARVILNEETERTGDLSDKKQATLLAAITQHSISLQSPLHFCLRHYSRRRRRGSCCCSGCCCWRITAATTSDPKGDNFEQRDKRCIAAATRGGGPLGNKMLPCIGRCRLRKGGWLKTVKKKTGTEKLLNMSQQSHGLRLAGSSRDSSRFIGDEDV